MRKEFSQIDWDEVVADDCRQIIRLAVREDLGRLHDWTTAALVPQQARGHAAMVSRQEGVIAGLPTMQVVLEEMETNLVCSPQLNDGCLVEAGTTLAEIAGPARHLLTAERLLLNLIGRLSGIATLTRRYVQAIEGTGARIYDTRKTTPGWRRLEKYAVRCGGGNNHRTGLFDAVLIKDNHLALGAGPGKGGITPNAAVEAARRFLRDMLPDDPHRDMIVEVEVDTLEQLREVLPAGPDIVLLDNMDASQLCKAVELRNTSYPLVELEASGGIHLQTVRAVAETGVDRISVGALTHSAVSLDVGLDWICGR